MSPLEDRARRRIGTILGGKYVLERVLGAGGMAAVYEGVHRNGNRVAVKVLHGDAAADPQTVARFRREGYVANSLGHPGAVRVLDDDVDADGSAFLVMELLTGETLLARAKRHGGNLPVREVLALGRDLCEVLAAAHDRGVIHRDIKPENLFLTTDRVLKVLDFGIARVAEAAADGRATNAGAALGTPAFMPPEQALGHSREVDARSDVWSAGATLFSLISGQLVHEAATATELLVAAATRVARSLAAVAPGIPAPIVAAVDRALRFQREERWPSAAAFRDALEEAHAAAFGEPISHEAVGPAPPAHPPSSRTAAELYFAETKEATGVSTSPEAVTGLGRRTLAISDQRSPLPSRPSAGDRASHESAPTLPAGDVTRDPGRATADPEGRSTPVPSTSGERMGSLSPSGDGTRGDARVDPHGPSPAAPSSRGGKVLGVVLALVVGVALWMARTGRSQGPGSLPPAGQAPCLADADCGAGWACNSGGRCVERRGCTSHRACVEEAGGAPSLCRAADGACVALRSEDCTLLAEPGDVGNDATVWIGAMFPTSDADATLWGKAAMDSVDLARRDFVETVGGLPPARPGGPRRPLAVVACDDARDPVRIADHLVGDLRLPVVLGFRRSKEVADLAASHFLPRGVLALATNTASMLRTIPRAPGQPRLVWRSTTSSDMVRDAAVAVLAGLVEPEIRAQPGSLAPGEPIRVALVRVGNASGLGTADGYVSALRFNGKSVAQNGEAFRQLVYADAADDATLLAETRRIAAELVAFQPHVIIGSTGTGTLSALTEQAWPASARFRPRWLDTSLDGPELADYVRRHPDARRRMLNVEALTSTPPMAKFVHRHNEVFATKVTAGDATPAPYDAFYVTAYAIAALGAEPITGPALARAIPRLLPPGEPVDVGPAGIYAALAALGSGRSIDLAGAQTTLDFDPETGDPTTDFSVLCLAPPKDGAAPVPVETGVVFRAREKKLEGTFRCP